MMKEGRLEASNTKPKVYSVFDPDSIDGFSTELENKIAYLIIEDYAKGQKRDIYEVIDADLLIEASRRNYYRDEAEEEKQSKV